MIDKVLAALAISALAWPASAAADNFETPSREILCVVSPDPTLQPPEPSDQPYDAVVCQGNFTQPGAAFNVTTTGAGTISWSNANLATDNPTIWMLDERNYHSGNWTIRSSPDGTTFTNTRTGHGMFVSIENVYAF